MRRKILPYDPHLKAHARYLRQHMTRAEVLLWHQLKARQIEGHDFDRQRPIDKYIVDFFCKGLMLAIEIDGVTHDNDAGQRCDQRRQHRLEALGVRFLRFQDEEVRQHMEGVIMAIREWIRENTHDLSGVAGERNAGEEPTPRLRRTPPRRG